MNDFDTAAMEAGEREARLLERIAALEKVLATVPDFLSDPSDECYCEEFASALKALTL